MIWVLIAVLWSTDDSVAVGHQAFPTEAACRERVGSLGVQFQQTAKDQGVASFKLTCVGVSNPATQKQASQEVSP